MDNILITLTPSQIAIDLGCGGGSFHYASYQCRIIGIDIDIDPKSAYRDAQRVQYIRSRATEIPLTDRSVDAIICNHTFEHFPHYKIVLREVDRVLKDPGALYIAIPNGTDLSMPCIDGSLVVAATSIGLALTGLSRTFIKYDTSAGTIGLAIRKLHLSQRAGS